MKSRTQFKNPSLQGTYQACLDAVADQTSNFWWNGKPSRGDGLRSAFWSGYDGQPSRYVRGSLAYAAWAAGRDHERKGR
jgi:hypothetical protein